MKKFLLVPLFFIFYFSFFISLAWAEACSTTCSDASLDKCIAECNKLIDISINATKPHEQKVEALQTTIAAVEKDMATLSLLIARRQGQIANKEKVLGKQQAVLEERIRDFYKKDYQSGLEYVLVTLFGGESLSETVQSLGYRQNLIDQDKRAISTMVLEITGLADDKRKLEETKAVAAQKKIVLEATLAPIKDLVDRAKAYQSQLSATAGSLSARQQELIAARLGSLGLSRSAGISMACADDRNIDPGFSPRLAFYTFGIPHRVGMNQFGAYGRAKAGQNYKDILNAYYSGISFEKKGNPNINVQGYGSMSLEQYMLGIYEVPDSWPMEALKAQAVAARSYALAYTNNGANSICTTQDCQVYKGGNKGGNWEQAVKQTEGEVMTNGGQAIKAWFSSTDGGYTHSSGDVFGGGTAWTKNLTDANGSVGSLDDLKNRAYDRDSPCFYNAQGWRTQYNKSAWLKPDEVADIVNVIMLSSSTSDWDSWDAGKVRSELQSRGITPFNKIDNVSMNFDFGYGRTTSVTLSGDAGSKTFDGKTFKDYFNVRAPANIAIVGPLYNIEKR
ncbi:SpoIID/LytB domain-containing protein [Candidatus Microgenomates bacterium]|nr:SpoIID/LytB domain-containing protein [Candidatus Microgenomates bacterium]